MRIIGPEPEPDPTDDETDGKLIESIQPTAYTTTATTNQMRMTQPMTWPAVVAVSDVRLFIVMTSTIIATMNIKMTSYMCDWRICAVYSYCAFNVVSNSFGIWIWMCVQLSVILFFGSCVN